MSNDDIHTPEYLKGLTPPERNRLEKKHKVLKVKEDCESDNMREWGDKALQALWEKVSAAHDAAYEIINREVDALVVIQPAIEGAIEALGRVDEEAAVKLADRLFEGLPFCSDNEKDAGEGEVTIWTKAKASMNLPTLARAAQMLRFHESSEELRELFEDERYPKGLELDPPRPRSPETKLQRE
jgi:hypothetical protein